MVRVERRGPGLASPIVSALVRAFRALGYYEASHPVFVQTLNEAHAALEKAFRLEPVLTLATTSTHLVIDVDGAPLMDEPAAALAQRMFKASVVAVRFGAGVRREELAALVRVLAETPERVRDAGGAGALLAEAEVRGLELLEVDFGGLFAGAEADLSPLVGGDAVAARALRELLRLREDQRSGEALGVRFDELGTPESLGALLDQLLERAEPGLVPGQAARTGEQPVSADELADAAARAYLENHGRLSGEEGAIAASAQVLSNALVRLSPEARFTLLRRLAGGEMADGSSEEKAVAALGAELPGKLLLETVAAALVERRHDSEAVRAVGNLIRRLRPLESERRRLMSELDQAMDRRKKPIDGVLWQELEARAFGDGGLGLLDLDLASRQAVLKAELAQRLRGQRKKVAGQEILASRSAQDRFAAQALAQVVRDGKGVPANLLEVARPLLAELDQKGGGEASMELVLALLERADSQGGAGSAALVRELLGGAAGLERTRQLARYGGQSRVMGEILLRALEGSQERSDREELLSRLAHFDGETLRELAEGVSEADAHRIQHLLRAALRADPRTAVRIAKQALKNPSLRAKEATLRSLVEAKEGEALGVVALAAGWKGEKLARTILNLSGPDAERRLHDLALVAVGVLGVTHHPLAVYPLAELLTRTKLIESKQDEELRQAAAHALATNGTPEAVAALEQGKGNKKKSIRELCARVLEGRAGRGRK